VTWECKNSVGYIAKNQKPATVAGFSFMLLPSLAFHPMFSPQVSFQLFSFEHRPLLEEKWDFDSQALISNIGNPFMHGWSCTYNILNFAMWLIRQVICFWSYNFVIPLSGKYHARTH
jgi:hypothetical protein